MFNRHRQSRNLIIVEASRQAHCGHRSLRACERDRSCQTHANGFAFAHQSHPQCFKRGLVQRRAARNMNRVAFIQVRAENFDREINRRVAVIDRAVSAEQPHLGDGACGHIDKAITIAIFLRPVSLTDDETDARAIVLQRNNRDAPVCVRLLKRIGDTIFMLGPRPEIPIVKRARQCGILSAVMHHQQPLGAEISRFDGPDGRTRELRTSAINREPRKRREREQDCDNHKAKKAMHEFIVSVTASLAESARKRIASLR